MNANNPRYWFRAKRYGWGWGLPITWQGWVFFISWLFTFIFSVRHLIPRGSSLHWIFVAAMIVLLISICYWKGKPPKWRWGDRE
jgi:hypothetical protein